MNFYENKKKRKKSTSIIAWTVS